MPTVRDATRGGRNAERYLTWGASQTINPDATTSEGPQSGPVEQLVKVYERVPTTWTVHCQLDFIGANPSGPSAGSFMHVHWKVTAGVGQTRVAIPFETDISISGLGVPTPGPSVFESLTVPAQMIQVEAGFEFFNNGVQTDLWSWKLSAICTPVFALPDDLADAIALRLGHG
jgi:hypothetical protein